MVCGIFHDDAVHLALNVQDAAEDLESGVRKDVIEAMQLHAETRIRLI